MPQYWPGAAGRFALFFLGGVLSLLALFSVEARSEPLRVQLQWHHQAQFAGIYVAEAKGYYADAGVEIELVEGGPGIATLERLGRKEVDVALAWLPAAIETRTRWDVVNIGQIFRDSGTAITCRRDTGVNQLEDIEGASIGAWYIGDEINLGHWLDTVGIPRDGVRMTAQLPDGRDLINGRVDCAMTMMYNEYWSILDSHLTPADLIVINLADQGLGFLEDGLYARRDALSDPERHRELAAFVGATMRGWAYAREHVDEALAISMARTPDAEPQHQRLMLNSILALIGEEEIGLLDLSTFERSIDMLGPEVNNRDVEDLADGAWTHRLWYEAGLGEESLVTVNSSTRHHLATTTASPWFTGLIVVGSIVFGFAGFMRAQQRDYDFWGAFVLTLLPIVGGGTIRDLLVGGDRYPPFIIQEPLYIHLALGTFVLGMALSLVTSSRVVERRAFDWTMKTLDTLGLATFTIIGAQVAMMAGLTWFWIPICAALTCAGGGMLSAIIMGEEPPTFRGEPYEEISVIGGLAMLMGLQLADAYEHVTWIAPAVIVATLILVFAMRFAVILFGIRLHTFGRKPAAELPATAGPETAG